MHRATQPFRWAALAATLVLAMGMAIVWSPSARATSHEYTCDNTSGDLTITLDGSADDITIVLNLDGSDSDLTVTPTSTSASDCDTDDLDSVRGMAVYGDDDETESVTFTAASTDDSDDWWDILNDHGIAIDLGDVEYPGDDLYDDDSLVLNGTSGEDTIDADSFAGYSNSLTVIINGGADEDDLDGTDSAPTILNGDSGADTLDGGSQNDTLNGGPQSDALTGGGGDDILNGGVGDDVIRGGSDSNGDTVDYSDRIGSVYVELGSSSGNGEGSEDDDIDGVENVKTGSGDDTIEGDSGPNVLDGGLGDDDIDGGADDDVVDYSERTANITVDLDAGTSGDPSIPEVDTLTSIEGANTGEGNDRLLGDAHDNVFNAGPGNDVIDAGEGADFMSGDDGNDLFLEGSDDTTSDGADASDDTIHGNNGKDTVDYSGRTYAVDDPGVCVLLDAAFTDGGAAPCDTDDASGARTDLITVPEKDLFSNTDVENAIGTAGEDLIASNSWPSFLQGRSSMDLLFGGFGEDRLSGGDGDDWLYGDQDDDRLTGGRGLDHLFGGVGEDLLDGSRDKVVDVLDGGANSDLCVLESTAEKTASSSCDTYRPKKYS